MLVLVLVSVCLCVCVFLCLHNINLTSHLQCVAVQCSTGAIVRWCSVGTADV